MRFRVHLRSLAPSLPQLWAGVVLAAIFVFLNLSAIRPHDFWWHVRVGQWIVEHGRVPGIDLFSYTRLGEPWAYQSWLMEVLFYRLLKVGDLPLVLLFHAVAVTLSYGLLLAVNRRATQGRLRSAALATLAAGAAGITNWGVRPQTISFPLFALTLYLLDRHASHSGDAPDSPWQDRALWLLPPVFVVWANAHGGFVFGLALLGAYLLACLVTYVRRSGPLPRHLLVVAILSAAATLLTPLGADMGGYVLGFLRHPATRTLNLEFQPPTVQTLDGQLFFGFGTAWVVLLLASGHRPRLHEWLWALLFGVLALMAARNEAWFAFVAAPVFAASLRCWARNRGPVGRLRAGRPALNLVLACLVSIVCLVSLPWFRPYMPRPEELRAYIHPETPVEAVVFLRELSPSRRTFHSEIYGSYMIWASPEIPVFIDTRFELYPLSQWQDYVALSYARYDWEAILERYDVETLFLQRETQQPLIDAALASPLWEVLYEDEDSVILEQQVGK
jgi:hypothetical protein